MRQGKRGWTEDEITKLKALVRAGASPFRVSVALGRSRAHIRAKAREIGCPFPSLREVKKKTRDILK
jgi:hypothetical protein